MADRTKEVGQYTLKACPCCGSLAKLEIDDSMSDSARWFFHVECTQCGIRGASAHNYDYLNGHLEVVAEWNERHGDRALMDELKSLLYNVTYCGTTIDEARISLEAIISKQESEVFNG